MKRAHTALDPKQSGWEWDEVGSDYAEEGAYFDVSDDE